MKENRMAGMDKLNDMDLGKVTGGVGEAGEENKWKWALANIDRGYLALRSAPDYDFRNEKVKIVNGTALEINPDKTDGEYVYAYFNGEYGWVNLNYISGFESHGTAFR
jgi:hypothetical protein